MIKQIFALFLLLTFTSITHAKKSVNEAPDCATPTIIEDIQSMDNGRKFYKKKNIQPLIIRMKSEITRFTSCLASELAFTKAEFKKIYFQDQNKEKYFYLDINSTCSNITKALFNAVTEDRDEPARRKDKIQYQELSYAINSIERTCVHSYSGWYNISSPSFTPYIPFNL